MYYLREFQAANEQEFHSNKRLIYADGQDIKLCRTLRNGTMLLLHVQGVGLLGPCTATIVIYCASLLLIQAEQCNEPLKLDI
jgi:hypothetical protein